MESVDDSVTAPAKVALGESALSQLDALLRDDTVEEIWVNSPDRVFAARDGQTFVTGVVLDCAALERFVGRLLLPTGRRLDALSPFVDASLPDGSRLHVAAAGICGPHLALNIRKFPLRAWTLGDLVDRDACTAEQAQWLREAVLAGKSILVSGATHTGKTTLLRALIGELPMAVRVVTCEEVFELRPQRVDVASMQTRSSSLEGHGEISLRELVVQALRMRPDLLVVGEVRQAEAFDLLLALNSGIPGLGSIHANNATAAIQKLATLALLAGTNVTPDFVIPTVSECIDVVVQLARDAAGHRRVVEICTVGLKAGVLVSSPAFLSTTDAVAA